MKHLALLVYLILNLSCTNYSVSKSKTVPPILVAITPISSVAGGYTIKMRVTNQEPFFAGYRLYVGDNENAARNPSNLNDGLACTSGPPIIPNQPIEYILEIATSVATLPANGNRLCTYETTLKSGQFLAIRTLLVSIQPSNQGGGNRINPSLPSNTLIVP